MAVRTPVYYDGTDIREVSSSDITKIKNRCVYLWGGSRSVNLSVVGSSGNLRRMVDHRDTASGVTNHVSSFQNPGATTDRGASTTYDRINQSTADGGAGDPGDTNNRKYPLFLNSGNLQAMSKQDMLDTFISPAIDILVDGNDRDGTYRIHTGTSLGSHTLISSTPVFIDQRFNTGFHGLGAGGSTTAELLPAATDQPTTITNYYLHRTNQGVYDGTPTFNIPLFLRTDNDIQTYTQSAIDSILSDLIDWAASSQTGYRIRYEVQGTGVDGASYAGNQRGSAMTDTTLNGSAVVNDQDGGDTYYSQRFPAGGSETETTYTLKIRKE